MITITLNQPNQKENNTNINENIYLKIVIFCTNNKHAVCNKWTWINECKGILWRKREQEWSWYIFSLYQSTLDHYIVLNSYFLILKSFDHLWNRYLQLHCRPSMMSQSKTPCFIAFLRNSYLLPTRTRLLGPTRLIHFSIFSHLHRYSDSTVIQAP